MILVEVVHRNSMPIYDIPGTPSSYWLVSFDKHGAELEDQAAGTHTFLSEHILSETSKKTKTSPMPGDLNDVYQHYLMRAKQEDQIRTALLAGKKPAEAIVNHGFLQTADEWQNRLFKKQPSTVLDFFLSAGVKTRSS